MGEEAGWSGSVEAAESELLGEAAAGFALSQPPTPPSGSEVGASCPGWRERLGTRSASSWPPVSCPAMTPASWASLSHCQGLPTREEGARGSVSMCSGVCVWVCLAGRKLAGHGFYLYLWALRSALHFVSFYFSLSLSAPLSSCVCLSPSGWLGLSDL